MSIATESRHNADGCQLGVGDSSAGDVTGAFDVSQLAEHFVRGATGQHRTNKRRIPSVTNL
jgi:hypothetical protein